MTAFAYAVTVEVRLRHGRRRSDWHSRWSRRTEAVAAYTAADAAWQARLAVRELLGRAARVRVVKVEPAATLAGGAR